MNNKLIELGMEKYSFTEYTAKRIFLMSEDEQDFWKKMEAEKKRRISRSNDYQRTKNYLWIPKTCVQEEKIKKMIIRQREIFGGSKPSLVASIECMDCLINVFGVDNVEDMKKKLEIKRDV